MAFPLGPLPSAGVLADLGKQTTPAKSIAILATTAYDFTDPAGGIMPCITEFYCTTAGNFVAYLAADSAGTVSRSYPVVVGQTLPGCFVRVDVSSTAAGIGRQ